MGHPHDHHPGHHHHSHHHHEPERPPAFTRRRLTRRIFVQEFGRRTFGVAILGTGILSVACSSDADTASSVAAPTTTAPAATTVPATTAPTPAPTAAPTVTPATARPTSVPETAPPDESDAPAASGDLRWEQVSLGFVSAYVLARGNEFAVVDTGTPGNEIRIGETVDMLGGTLSDVSHVVLTHLHGDHVGSLPGLMALAEGATAYAGEADISSITSPRAITGVNDGDEIFGMQVVATPGHTAGHICLWDQAAGLLVAGDAINEAGGVVGMVPDQFTADKPVAIESAKRLGELDYSTALFGHGEPILTGASAAVASAFVDL